MAYNPKVLAFLGDTANHTGVPLAALVEKGLLHPWLIDLPAELQQDWRDTIKALGFNARPQRKFPELHEIVRQYNDGLVTFPELLMALQLVPAQKHFLAHALLMPPRTLERDPHLSDWDEVVDMAVERNN